MGNTIESVEIERVHGLTPEVFHQRYLTGVGKPVVVTDALSEWGARSKWSFDWFKSHYGSDTVTFGGLGTKCVKVMKLGDYIDYLDAPQEPSKGFWLDPVTNLPCKGALIPPATILYLAWNVFPRHPELLRDVDLSPAFVEDWLPFLPEAFHKILNGVENYFSTGLLLGPKGCGFGLHRDVLHTHAYLAQIVGRKRCILFHPDCSDALYHGKVDVDQPDFEKYPLFRQATAFECVLAPGELLFIPCSWWHHVVALEKSVTVNYNFINRANFSRYLTDVFRDLPKILKELERCPDSKSDLGIDWVCKGFDFPESSRV